MRTVSIALVLILVSQFIPKAQACGDKFLVIGGRLRIERAYPAKHPSALVLYATNDKKMKDLEKTLKTAGHKTIVVDNEQQLFSTLNSARFDLVVVNFDQTPGLDGKIAATSSSPLILPIIDQPRKAKIALNAAQEPCLLKYQDKSKDAIKRIDQVIGQKMANKPIKCDWN